MIKTLRKAHGSKVKIFIMIPPPLFPPYPYEMNATVINEIFPELIRDISEVADTSIIDLRSAIIESNIPDEELTCDGCHPTERADMVIAETVYDSIIEYVNQQNTLLHYIYMIVERLILYVERLTF